MNEQQGFKKGCGGFEDFGIHEYADHACTKCGTVFCWSCSGSSNRHEGGRHHPEFETCPNCGHDRFAD